MESAGWWNSVTEHEWDRMLDVFSDLSWRQIQSTKLYFLSRAKRVLTGSWLNILGSSGNWCHFSGSIWQFFPQMRAFEHFTDNSLNSFLYGMQGAALGQSLCIHSSYNPKYAYIKSNQTLYILYTIWTDLQTHTMPQTFRDPKVHNITKHEVIYKQDAFKTNKLQYLTQKKRLF